MTEIKKLTTRPNIVMFIVMLAFLTYGPITVLILPEFIWGNRFFNPSLFAVLPIAYLFITRQRPKAILPRAPVSKKNWLYITLISFGIATVVYFVVFLFYTQLGIEVLSGAILTADLGMPPVYGIIMGIITSGVMHGFLEEVVFRGMLDGEYRRQGIPVAKYVIVTALLFGVIHNSFAQMIWAMAFGVMWTFMVHYTRSIWPAIFSHFLVNSLIHIINPVYYFNNHADYYAFLPRFSLILGVAAAIFIPIMIICWRKFVSDNPRRDEVLVIGTRSFKWTYWALIATIIVLFVVF